MIRLPVCLIAASIALAACGGGSSAPQVRQGSPTPIPTAKLVRVSPPPRPTSVPAGTTPIDQTTFLGAITPRPRNTPATSLLRHLSDATCADAVAVFKTSMETIYAGLDCGSFWDERAKQYFVNKDVAITMEISTSRDRLLFATADGATAEFTVEGIWVQ